MSLEWRVGGAYVIDDIDNAMGHPMPEGEVPVVPPEPRAQQAPLESAPAESVSADVVPPTPDEPGGSESASDAHNEARPETETSPGSQPDAAPAHAPNGRVAGTAKAAEASSDGSEEEIRKEWYILKVQSNREESIKEGLMRRVRAAGLDRYFGECIVPTEMVSEFKGGKKRVTKRKLYPGYLVVHMAINDDTWYLVRETTGIGDFTGSVGRPTPMLPQDVQKILSKSEEKTDEAPKLKISFKKGDRVKINEGTFENFEGEVDTIDEGNGRVSVMINIFGRSTPVELEYWQIEAL
jgi:transcription termination/antitermination protein NusG